MRFMQFAALMPIAGFASTSESPKLLRRDFSILSSMKEGKLLRLLKEMLRNSKRSDREKAKTIGVSQPIVTRAGARLQMGLHQHIHGDSGLCEAG
jgi:hypothetical protein